MDSILQDETKMHYIIIGLLSLSILLLLTHINQMNKAKKRAQMAQLRREGFYWDNTQTKPCILEGTCQLDMPTQAFQDLLDISAESGMNPLKNTWVGESQNLEKTKD